MMMITHHGARGHGSPQYDSHPSREGATFTGTGGGWSRSVRWDNSYEHEATGPIYPVRHLVKQGKKVHSQPKGRLSQ
jgi:hypothetical protein